MSDTRKVAEVEWTYRDRWSAPEANGFTYHVDLATAQKYIKDYWDSMPDSVQDEYNSPGAPVLIDVNAVFGMLVEGKGTVKSFEKVT